MNKQLPFLKLEELHVDKNRKRFSQVSSDFNTLTLISDCVHQNINQANFDSFQCAKFPNFIQKLESEMKVQQQKDFSN